MSVEIKVLGPGCANCTRLAELTKKAVEVLGVEAVITKVEDMAEIMRYTMSTPGLVINGKLRHSGKPLPTIDAIKKYIKESV